MATVITVHGTNDTGPDAGDKWWQLGGPLDQDIQRWVTSDTDGVRVKPLRWSGLNSEAGRYSAGASLADEMAALEAAGEPYCVLGHSHGGSAIGHALGLAHQRGETLANMRRWITVGTPFIDVRRRLLLFSRLTTRGVAAYLIVFYLFVMWLAFVASSVFLGYEAIARGGPGLRNPTFDIMIIVLAALFLLGLYVLLRKLQPNKVRNSNVRFRAALAQKFGSRWLPLRHTDDEAINGGRLLKDVKFEPFRSDFASPRFAFLSLLLIPLGLYFFADPRLYSTLSYWIAQWAPAFEPAPICPKDASPTSDCADPFKNFARNSLAVVVLPAIPLFQLWPQLGVTPSADANFNLMVVGGTLLAAALIGFVAIWILGVVLHRIVLVSSHALSSLLSDALNKATREQVISLGYGGDSHGEIAVGASPNPAWLNASCPCLPKALEAEISESSDRAAGLALSRMRAALSTAALEGEGNAADLLTRHITWSELVHTNYFRVPRMRKLIAYMIARQPGFRPTEAFQRDPDYALMGQWADEIERAGRA